jgi:hypothetical protein
MSPVNLLAFNLYIAFFVVNMQVEMAKTFPLSSAANASWAAGLRA